MKYKLIVFDMDGVIFEYHNFYMEIHKVLGTYEKGLALTKKYLKTDYPRLVKEVPGKLWKGKNVKPYLELVKSINYVKGAKETLKKLKEEGYKTAIITSGTLQQVQRIKKECGLDYYHSHNLVIENNTFTGEYNWGEAYKDKTKYLKEFTDRANCTLEETVFVGHDYNDLTAIKIAGCGIAFCPTDKEVEKGAKEIIRTKDLREILKIIK